MAGPARPLGKTWKKCTLVNKLHPTNIWKTWLNDEKQGGNKHVDKLRQGCFLALTYFVLFTVQTRNTCGQMSNLKTLPETFLTNFFFFPVSHPCWSLLLLCTQSLPLLMELLRYERGLAWLIPVTSWCHISHSAAEQTHDSFHCPQTLEIHQEVSSITKHCTPPLLQKKLSLQTTKDPPTAD